LRRLAESRHDCDMTDTDGVRDLFDGLASEYDRYLPFFETFGSALVRWWGPRPGQRVLDVGAGRGAITIPAAHAVGSRGQVLAVDNADGMVALLAKDCVDLPQVDVRVMDAHRLELPTASFDVVTYGFVLHFLNDPAEAIAEAHRVLRPDGLLVFSGPPTGVSSGGGSDTRWDFYRELMDEMTRRTDGSDRSELFGGPPRPLPTLCAEAGFIAVEHYRASMLFSFRDPQHYWNWAMSHGFRGFVDSLGSELSTEFRLRLFAGLERLHTGGGITVEPDVAFTRAHKPGTDDY
jgi:ubiquinone/menaquinone biosynthesis C-methylase UbiE